MSSVFPIFIIYALNKKYYTSRNENIFNHISLGNSIVKRPPQSKVVIIIDLSNEWQSVCIDDFQKL